MFWKQKPPTSYPTTWRPMFVMNKLCVGFDKHGNEIWARFEWVERRWLDPMKEEIRCSAATKPVVYSRPGLHPY